MFSAQKFLVITKKFVNPVKFLSSQAYKAVSFDVLSNEFSGTAVIALNSPQNKNGLSKLLVSEINQILDEIELNNSIRVLLVRSLVPGIFCAGADLKERAKMPLNEVPVTVCGLRRLMARLYNFQVPVLAAIDGFAFGGGLEMALGCDIRIAASDSKMGLVETRLAIIPGAGGTQYLPRIINPSLAKELIYTARVLSADEAKENGIVNHVVIQNDTKDAAYKKALDVAKEILPNGPVAVKMAKKAINKGLEVGLETGFAIEEACYSQILHTNDRLEGLAAFNEKRRPKYKGE